MMELATADIDFIYLHNNITLEEVPCSMCITYIKSEYLFLEKAKKKVL